MASNISLTDVIYLIFNQCKQPNSEFANADTIIEYIKNNFDYNNEEAKQLQFNELFNSLRTAGKLKNNLLSKDEFEKVFKIWIPPVNHQNEQLSNDDRCTNDVIFNRTRNRLSRSLTNLKLQIDNNYKHDCCGTWHHWGFDISANDENMYGKYRHLTDHLNSRTGTISPHEDPFRIPLNVIKSTPIKTKLNNSYEIGILQQPNLRHIKPYRDSDHSFSDSEMVSKNEGSVYGADSNENIDVDKIRYHRKRHRSSVIGEEYLGDLELKDLISQIRQIKFKNSQLVEINDRLQTQLELAEDNIRGLSSKYMDFEKRSKRFADINDENQQLIVEIDDIRKCIDSEMAIRRRIQSEKIMTEGELATAKEYIQSLIDRLSTFDTELEKKDKIITNLKSMISQQEEFCIKLQKLNLEKEEELQKNQKGIRDLTDVIFDYEEKIQIMSKQKNDLEMQLMSDIVSGNEFILPITEPLDDSTMIDRGCGGVDDEKQRITTQSEFKPLASISSPWSIKLELAKELIQSPGDSPLCEKSYFDEDLLKDSSDDSSFQMLSGLSTMINSLRMTLGEYREQLENASRSFRTNEHFSDEISLSYLSYLNDAINLISSSTEKAASCQRQFNDTFNLLMKRISILKNEKKTLISRNEKLLLQLNESPNILSDEVTDKMYFLEEQLRNERLSSLQKEKEIEELKGLNHTLQANPKCSQCYQEIFEYDCTNEITRRDLEALNLEKGSYEHQKYAYGKRRYTVGEVYAEDKAENFLKSNLKKTRMSSTSLGNLSKMANIEESVANDDRQLSTDRDFDEELELCRSYNMSTDNLLNIPRYKISRASTYDVDIEDLIENSWLETHSKMEERRASVFAQIDHDDVKRRDSDAKYVSNDIAENESKRINTMLARTRSSSCSSSNDTSDGNSVDLLEERKKLAQQLEIRAARTQSRSPVTTLLSSSLAEDDLKSITPTVCEPDLIQTSDDNVSTIETGLNLNDSNGIQNKHRNSSNEDLVVTENVAIESSSRQRKQSIIRTVSGAPQISIIDTQLLVNRTDMRLDLPTISIMEPLMSYPENEQSDFDVGINDNIADDNGPVKITQSFLNDSNEIESMSLHASLNKSTSSRPNSSVSDEKRNSRSSNSKLRPKRMIRPHTIAVTNLNAFKSTQDDSLSIYDEPSLSGDMTDIQEAIDMLNETSQSLLLISPDELENKYAESVLMYRTDRPTIADRAIDANSKCNRALTNVEQEFNILRHLIKSFSGIVEQPCDLVPRIKTSINVLEKCVEYLSAKSETLGSVQQEIKLSCLVDVIHEYSAALQKQKENHLRELEELRNSFCLLNEMGMNNPIEPSRPKRSMLTGKDARTRFQMVAQNTAIKTSILRQFSNSARKGSEITASPDDLSLGSPKHEPKSVPTRTTGGKLVDFSRKVMDDDNFKSLKIAVSKFFPTTPAFDDSDGNLFQKGLTQGLRISTDQTLSDLRAQQSKFSSTLDAMSDMIEECESLDDDVGQFDRRKEARISAMKDRISLFFCNLKTALGKMAYVAIGLIVMVGVLLPWIFIPADNEAPSLSGPVSRRRSYSVPDSAVDSQDPSPSSPSLFLSNINVIRHNPAAV